MTYAFIEILDPHVSDNPMFSMPGLPEEGKAHLLADEPCESHVQNLAKNQKVATGQQTPSAIRPNDVIGLQNLFLNAAILLRLL